MSIRVTAFCLIVLFLSGYAWFRSWFIALCGMIVLIAFLEHRDMPRAIGGITGLNLWNFLYLNVFFAWLKQRSSEGLKWDLPRGLTWSVWLFWIVIAWSCGRLMRDPYGDPGIMLSLVDHFINPIKIFLPCLMLYDGCRNRERIRMALFSVLSAYVFLAVQSVKYMGLGSFGMSGSDLSARAIRVLDKFVGFHRVDLSMIFAGAFWAIFAFSQAFKERSIRWGIMATLPIVLFGQAVTGGRTGYVTWVMIGLILGVLKWRRILLVVPVGIVLAVAFLPGVQDRMLSGFGTQQGVVKSSTDLMEVTSGRTGAWPLVIEMIGEQPIFGYGKDAMRRTGLAARIEYEKGGNPDLSGGFSHPHNAYLEALFDNGFVGFLATMPIYFLAFSASVTLFFRGRDPLFVAVGGVGLSLILALLIAGIGAQTFYPRIGVFGLWATVGVVWRIRRMPGGGVGDEEEDDLDDDSWENSSSEENESDGVRPVW